jgi:hypothetical protein
MLKIARRQIAGRRSSGSLIFDDELRPIGMALERDRGCRGNH